MSPVPTPVQTPTSTPTPPASTGPQPLDTSAPTSLFDATSFLYTGTGAPQAGVAPGTINFKRVAVLRGKVIGRDGEPIQGVAVTVHDHPEYGQVLTQGDGGYELAVNGGGPLVLQFGRGGFLDVQRAVDPPWQEYTILDSVVLVSRDVRATLIEADSTAEFQVARGTPTQDPDGTRQATLLFPHGADATMRMPDGSTRALGGDLTVRATEFTVGNLGDAAMPGTLPPTSGYTYAVDFTIDEAEAAGATSVQFDEPIVNYTENFIGAPVGSPVPTGSYDAAKGAWTPERNGRVIKLLRESDGRAEVDTDGDGSADTGSGIGMTDAERERLAQLYDGPQELWRVRITHFSAWDHNWPFGPPRPAPAPPLDDTPEPNPDDQCHSGGSIIGCENQTLGESIGVTGTPFSLTYSSDRVPGWKAKVKLDVPIVRGAIPDRLKGVQLTIDVAGRRFEQRWENPANPTQAATSLPDLTPNLTYAFDGWDGRDAFGRQVLGRPRAYLTLTYVYDFIYYAAAADFNESFAQFSDGSEIFDGRQSCGNQRPAMSTGFSLRASGAGRSLLQAADPNTDPNFLCGVPVERRIRRNLGAWDASGVGLGSWTLDAHHQYDPFEHVLHLGDGTTRSAETIGQTVTTVAGGGGDFPAAEGALATDANLDILGDIATAPDGSFYEFSGSDNQIRKIGTDGRIRSIAGVRGAVAEATCDGRAATQAELGSDIRGLAVASDGTLYFAAVFGDYPAGYLCRVTPGGTIERVAGSGVKGAAGGIGDGGPAVDAKVSDPIDVAVTPDGRILWSERGVEANGFKARVRQINADGTVSTIAGGGTDASANEDLGAGEPATAHNLSVPYGLAADPDGNIYIPLPVEHIVVKVGPDGVLTRFAGDRSDEHDNDGGPALLAGIGSPTNVAVGRDGAVYIRGDGGAPSEVLIRRVSPDGNITTAAGARRGVCGFSASQNGELAGGACIESSSRGLEALPDGGVLYGDGRREIRRIGEALPGFEPDSLALPSSDGLEVYEFTGGGRHLRTVDALTGALRWRFAYDAGNRLASAVDGDGNSTRIERDDDGHPTAIVAPGGQRTKLRVNADGYLSSIEDPAGGRTDTTYAAGGLLSTLTDARRGVHRFAYEDDGRLRRDESPAGNVKTLTAQRTATNSKVTLETGQGRKTIYETEIQATGDMLRSITGPTGAQTTLRIDDDGTLTVAEADGTRRTYTPAPDPRFGVAAPLIGSERIETPGGKVSETTVRRTADLADDANPLSVLELRDSITVANPSGSDATWNVLFDSGRPRSTGDATRPPTLAITSPEQVRSVQTLNDKGHVVRFDPPSKSSGALAAVLYSYDTRGRVTQTRNGSQSRTFKYDDANRLGSEEDATGAETHYGYDPAGRVTDVEAPTGAHLRSSYDANANRTDVVMPNGARHTLEYTPDDRLASYRPPGSPALTRTYSQDGDLDKIGFPSSRELAFQYDAAGRVTGATSDEAETALNYAGATNRVTRRRRTPTGGIAQDLDLTYDGALPEQMTLGGAATGTFTYTYGAGLRLSGLGLQSGADTVAIGLDRDRDGLLTGYGPFSLQRSGPGGTATNISDSAMGTQLEYDALGQMSRRTLTVGGTQRHRSALSYDDAGRLARRVETLGDGSPVTFDFVHDSGGRLTEVKRGGTTIERYGYDANANRTSRQSESMLSPETATYDAQDRLISQGTMTYSYDADGRLTQRGADRFAYAARGELVEATIGAETITYGYDQLGRRTTRTAASGTTQYLYGDPGDLDDTPGSTFAPTATRDPSGQLTTYYYDDDNRLFAMQRGASRFYVATDEVGSPRVITDDTGAVVKEISYDAFGSVRSDSAPTLDLPIGFAGGLVDPDTKLVNFGFRDYDPVAGRWTSRDPILYDGGQANLYAYAANDPVDRNDRNGLDDELLPLPPQGPQKYPFIPDVPNGKPDPRGEVINVLEKSSREGEKGVRTYLIPFSGLWKWACDQVTGGGGDKAPDKTPPPPSSRPLNTYVPAP